MKIFLTALFCFCALGGAAIAQDDAEFQQWMKATGAELGALRKMDDKTGPEAAASAEKVSGLYEQVAGYFAKKNVADATQMSQDGKVAADELAAAAKAGDSEKANAAFKSLGGTCKGCHDAHREKAADGSYKFK